MSSVIILRRGYQLDNLLIIHFTEVSGIAVVATDSIVDFVYLALAAVL